MERAVAVTADGVPVVGIGNHSQEWEPSGRDVPSHAAGMAEVELAGKSIAARPSEADKRAAFGPPQRLPDGTMGWRVDLSDPKKKGAHDELVREWRRVEREKCGRYNGRPKVAMRNRDTGEQVHVFEESADDVARKRGLTPLSSGWKGSRIVTGPDRMLWKWAGDTLRWWPTGRTCLGTPLGGGDPTAMSPQRDPDGRTWLTNAEGEWVRLELFVEG